MRVTDAQYRPAQHLAGQRFGMDHSSDVSNREEIRDVVLAGLDIHFNFREARDVGKRLAVVRILIFCRRDQTLSRQPSDGSLGVLVHIFGRFVTVVFAAQFDGVLRRLGQCHTRAAALVEDFFVRDFVLLRFTAVGFGRDFLQLRTGVHGHGVRRAGHGMSGLAAAGDAGPGQVLGCIAPGDIALLPGHAQHLGHYPVNVADGFRAQVADS